MTRIKAMGPYHPKQTTPWALKILTLQDEGRERTLKARGVVSGSSGCFFWTAIAWMI